jgi:tetratricopeptide (TPR) repeat protein
MLLLFGCTVLYSINYDIHDIDSYFLLAFITSGAWIVLGFQLIAEQVKKRPAWIFIGTGIFSLAPVVYNFSTVNESKNYMVEDCVYNIFNGLEENALIISYQWDYWLSASYYLQQVNHQRRDLTIIDKELLRRSWYLHQMDINHPEIMKEAAAVRKKFEKELYNFERDLPYNQQRIEWLYNELINTIINNAYPKRPVYITFEIEQQFAPGYIRVPQGLAFRLYKEPPPLENIKDFRFKIRPFPRAGRLENALYNMYVKMAANHGFYFYSRKSYKKALEYFEYALTLQPQEATIAFWRDKARSDLLAELPEAQFQPDSLLKR